MSQNFRPGDFLVFQLEAGFALLRLLSVDETDTGKVWHVAAYGDFFPDVESAEAVTAFAERLTVNSRHMALSNRAFESTQVARLNNIPLNRDELTGLIEWQQDPQRQISDRSVRLLLGFR